MIPDSKYWEAYGYVKTGNSQNLQAILYDFAISLNEQRATSSKTTMLHTATFYGKVECVGALLQQNARPDIENSRTATALDDAQHIKDEKSKQLLLICSKLPQNSI